MTVLKTAKEIEAMKKAGEISAGALRVARDYLKVGVSTAYVDEKVREYIVSQGATPSFLGYDGFPKTTCISINDEVIHGIPGSRLIKDGDIVSVDVGAFIDGYHGDNAYTFGIGNVSEKAQRLIDVTKESLMRGVAAAKAGNRIGDIGHAVQEYAEANGYSVIRDFVGHGVGHDMHEEPDVPNYGRAGRGLRLVPGMTIAIEPMISEGDYEIDILDNDWTVVTTDGSDAAHFEFTIAITDSEPIVLTDWRKVL